MGIKKPAEEPAASTLQAYCPLCKADWNSLSPFRTGERPRAFSVLWIRTAYRDAPISRSLRKEALAQGMGMGGGGVTLRG